MILRLLILLALGWPGVSWGAITFDAGTGSSGSETTTQSHSHTTASGASVMLFGVTGSTTLGNTAGTITAPTYNSVSATTRISTTIAHFNAIVQEVWCLDNPASGAHTASVTISGLTAGTDVLSLSVMTFSGTGTCSQITNTSTNNGTDASLTVTLSGVASTSVIGDVACSGTDLTVGANQTNRASANDGSNSCASRGESTQLGSDGGVMTWSSSGSDTWVITAYEIPQGAGGGGGGSTPSRLPVLGVGP